MVPDLMPADVTIFDVTRGQAYVGERTDDSSDSVLLQRRREFTRQYEQQIQKALSHIPHAGVNVHVDLDALKSSMIRSETVRTRPDSDHWANREETNADSDPHQAGFRGSDSEPTETSREVVEKQLVAAMPKAVQVSISIPREYIRAIVARRSAKGETAAERLDPSFVEEEVISKVERIVDRLIPADSPAGAISVTCVDRLISDLPPAASANSSVSLFMQQWGSPIAYGSLVLIALLGLGLIRRTPPTISSPTESSELSLAEIEPPTSTEFSQDSHPSFRPPWNAARSNGRYARKKSDQ